mmetsp:Transcript_453/g.916  ORF Transcript_453/g.916 Transcript_453/m.916 type:complete len:247 (-) Transcript_453:256-996(-)
MIRPASRGQRLPSEGGLRGLEVLVEGVEVDDLLPLTLDEVTADEDLIDHEADEALPVELGLDGRDESLGPPHDPDLEVGLALLLEVEGLQVVDDGDVVDVAPAAGLEPVAVLRALPLLLPVAPVWSVRSLEAGVLPRLRVDLEIGAEPGVLGFGGEGRVVSLLGGGLRGGLLLDGEEEAVVHDVVLGEELDVALDLLLNQKDVLLAELDEVDVLVLVVLLDALQVEVLESGGVGRFLGYRHLAVDD